MAAQADNQEFKPRFKGKRKHGDETCEVIKRVKFSESAWKPWPRLFHSEASPMSNNRMCKG